MGVCAFAAAACTLAGLKAMPLPLLAKSMFPFSGDGHGGF
jgi:hypothetical protein